MAEDEEAKPPAPEAARPASEMTSLEPAPSLATAVPASTAVTSAVPAIPADPVTSAVPASIADAVPSAAPAIPASPAAPGAEKAPLPPPNKLHEWIAAAGIMAFLALVFWMLLNFLRSASM